MSILIKLFLQGGEEPIESYYGLTVPQAGDRIFLPDGTEKIVYNDPRHILIKEGKITSLEYVRINLK